LTILSDLVAFAPAQFAIVISVKAFEDTVSIRSLRVVNFVMMVPYLPYMTSFPIIQAPIIVAIKTLQDPITIWPILAVSDFTRVSDVTNLVSLGVIDNTIIIYIESVMGTIRWDVIIYYIVFCKCRIRCSYQHGH
jgi:hypothetical protein